MGGTGPASPQVGTMRLALVGWAADSGVGRELIDSSRHLPVSAAFVLSNPTKPTRRDLVKVPVYYSSGQNLNHEMGVFLDRYKPDTILTWEVPGAWSFPEIWEKAGIRWVHMVHWDWFNIDKGVWKLAAALLAPNRMCQEELEKRKLDSVLLPVPIDTGRFQFRLREKADHFISVYAYGGQHDRRSLPEIFACWNLLEPPQRLTVFAQKRPPELDGLGPVPGIEVMLGNAPDPWMLYDFGDVAVQPSRYEGVGVSMLEAQACGVPVIAVDAPPMNEVAPDLLVSVREKTEVEIYGKKIFSHVPHSAALRAQIESLSGKSIREFSMAARKRVEQEYSWNVLLARWMEVLKG